MTMQSISTALKKAGAGWDDAASGAADLKSVLTECQGYKQDCVAAVASGECAAITGMTASDTIKSVIKITSGVMADATANYTAAAGGMTCSVDADSNADGGLLVLWVDARGA